MALRLIFAASRGQFKRAMEEIYEPIAEAGTLAMVDAATIIKADGRSDIASAGFGKRWQNTFRADVFPKRGFSANAAALIYHKIPYADIFETGGMIRGKPIMWIPLRDTPKKLGRNRMTADVFRQQIGPLSYIKRPGGPPLLAGKVSMSKRAAASGAYPKPTLGNLRKGAAGLGTVRPVPLFVGADTVTLRDRFSLREIIERARRRLPELYLKNLKVE